MKRTWKRLLIAALVLAAVGITSFYLALWWTFDYSCQTAPWSRATYERDAWMKAEPSERHTFVRDIIDTGRFLGMTRDQLHQALGEPDYRSKQPPYDTYLVRYFRGLECGFNALAVLQFDFDNGGTVVDQALRFD